MYEPMDYADILDLAEKNNEENKIAGSVRRYDLEFKSRPKPKAVNPGVNEKAVQRLLKKQKREEILKKVEEETKKRRLLEERAKNSKAQGMISSMLKRTKSAMKGLQGDAGGSGSGSADTSTEQPDNDDYGYTSSYANQLHASLMKKYESSPLPDKFPARKQLSPSDLNSAKERVKRALNEEEESGGKGHRKRHRDSGKEKESEASGSSGSKRNSEKDGRNGEKSSSHEKDTEKKKRPRPTGPPPMSYEELLQHAAMKKDEPVVIPSKEKKLVKEYEFDRPMTQKEKEEYIRERDARLRRDGKLPRKKPVAPTLPDAKKLLPSTSSSLPVGKIPLLKNKVKPEEPSQKLEKPIPKQEKPVQKPEKPSFDRSNEKPGPSAQKPSFGGKPGPASSKVVPGKPGPLSMKLAAKSSTETLKSSKSTPTATPGPSNVKVQSVQPKPKSQPPSSANKPRPKEQPYVPKPVAGSSSKVAQVSYKPTKIAPVSKNPPSKSQPGPSSSSGDKPKLKVEEKRPGLDPWSRLAEERKKAMASSMKKQKPPPPRRRIESDSEEEEYDSEMDDFIDDGPLDGQMDISKEISALFGYDRNKYADLDDEDDECMEASYSQQLKEEFRSTKAGILEDLREARLQKLEKQKMKQKQKK